MLAPFLARASLVPVAPAWLIASLQSAQHALIYVHMEGPAKCKAALTEMFVDVF